MNSPETDLTENEEVVPFHSFSSTTDFIFAAHSESCLSKVFPCVPNCESVSQCFTAQLNSREAGTELPKRFPDREDPIDPRIKSTTLYEFFKSMEAKPKVYMKWAMLPRRSPLEGYGGIDIEVVWEKYLAQFSKEEFDRNHFANFVADFEIASRRKYEKQHRRRHSTGSVKQSRRCDPKRSSSDVQRVEVAPLADLQRSAFPDRIYDTVVVSELDLAITTALQNYLISIAVCEKRYPKARIRVAAPDNKQNI